LPFKTGHSGVLYIFEPRRGAQTSRGRGNLPPIPLLIWSGLPVTDVLAVWTAKPPLRLSGPDRR